MLEGFNCKLYTEEELVQWYTDLITQDKKDIIHWINEFWEYSNTIPEESPEGEFPDGEELDEDEKPKIISVGKPLKS